MVWVIERLDGLLPGVVRQFEQLIMRHSYKVFNSHLQSVTAA